MGACAAKCTQAEYRERVNDIILLLQGNTAELVERLRSRMDAAAKKLEFEEAAHHRDTIRALWKVSRQRVSDALQQELDSETWQDLLMLQKLLGLNTIPWRIDAFDISHISGHDTYGCVVVFEQGRPNTSLYRRFKIKSLKDGEIDDFRSMQETVLRRYKRLIENSEPMPQLVLIDGGPIQLEFAIKSLAELNLSLPIIALAERDELVFLPDRPNDPIELGLDDPILKLLQRIRNEVHRYAVTTHRSARNSRLRRSALEDIPGIGKKRAALLLVKFGSVQRIATLTPEELCELEGVGIKLAKKIIEHLTGGGKG